MNLPLDPDEHFVVTCGSTEAMMVAMMTACNPGDRVIVFSPFYENYAPMPFCAALSPYTLRCIHPSSASIPTNCDVPLSKDPRLWSCAIRRILRAGCSRGKSCFALPNWRKSTTALSLTDEVYEHIVYAPHQHVYFAALPGMFERTISCNSLSKTYSITGWRLGYVIGRLRHAASPQGTRLSHGRSGRAIAGSRGHRPAISRQLLQ